MSSRQFFLRFFCSYFERAIVLVFGWKNRNGLVIYITYGATNFLQLCTGGIQVPLFVTCTFYWRILDLTAYQLVKQADVKIAKIGNSEIERSIECTASIFRFHDQLKFKYLLISTYPYHTLRFHLSKYWGLTGSFVYHSSGNCCSFSRTINDWC